jgi:hypothetical protein
VDGTVSEFDVLDPAIVHIDEAVVESLGSESSVEKDAKARAGMSY